MRNTQHRKTVVLLLVCLLAGCEMGPKAMTNEEIISETKYCADNGMATRVLTSVWNFRTVIVECEAVKIKGHK